MTVAEAIGPAVRSARVAQGMTQRQLAMKMGLAAEARTYMTRVENGLLVPTIASLGKIAAALATQPSVLLAAAEEYMRAVNAGETTVLKRSRVREPKQNSIVLPANVRNKHAMERRRKLAESLGTLPVKGK